MHISERCRARALALTLLLCASPVSAADLLFFQDSFETFGSDGGLPIVQTNTDWGSARLSYLGVDTVQYFNLSVGGDWVVRNMPLGHEFDDGTVESRLYDFGLGSLGGTTLSSVSYGFSIGDSLLGGAPAETGTAAVAPRLLTGGNGQGPGGQKPKPQPDPPPVAAGDEVASHASIKKPVNQQCGVNQCVPAAASNSLQYLNTKFKLGIADNLISIPTLATAFGTTVASGTADGWENRKKDYFKANDIPVSTLTVTKLEDILKAIQKGKDVELIVSPQPGGTLGHAVFVTGIWKLKSGNWVLDIVHDTDQKDMNKGLESQSILYDAKTKTLSGYAWVTNRTISKFVVESPTAGGAKVPEPASWTMLILGFGLLGGATRYQGRRACAGAAQAREFV
jgi:hypothetical protein